MEKRDVVVYSEDYKKLVDATALKDKYYEIDERVEEICKEAFKGCDKLEEIVMPKKLKKIDSEAFQGCSSLTKLTLPDSVARIDGLAFCGCSGLTELTLPNSVKSIGDGAFADCSGLEKITVESGNSCYDSRDNCNSIIETATNTLIAGCKNSVIPNSVASIWYEAFCGCSGLTELTLPNSVTSIGNCAFGGCSGLTELTLPNSITSIGDYAFAYCSDLSKITSLAEIPPMCGRGVFDGVNKTNCELIVPEGSVAAYTRAEDWNKFSNIRGFSK